MYLILLLLPLTLAKSPHKHDDRADNNTGFFHPTFLQKEVTISGLTHAQNAEISKCIQTLSKTPTDCQIYMKLLMEKFLPIMFTKEFILHEVLSWTLDRYDNMMSLCDYNCYNLTLYYSRNCTGEMPIDNIFPNITSKEFHNLLLDTSTLMCYKSPEGQSCLKYEAEYMTDRVKVNQSLADACYIKEDNKMVLPAVCSRSCKWYLSNLTDRFGCCMNSWRHLEKYSIQLKNIKFDMHADMLFNLLNHCQVPQPGSCPFQKDRSLLYTSFITFLAVMSGLATLLLFYGIVVYFKDN